MDRPEIRYLQVMGSLRLIHEPAEVLIGAEGAPQIITGGVLVRMEATSH